jgi:hypothetical protein
VPRAELWLGPYIEDDDITARQPPLQLCRRHLIEAIALAQVLVRKNGDLGHMSGGNLSHRSPQLTDTIARQAVIDARSIPPRAEKTRLHQHLKMLRGVRNALRDLNREFVDRPLALREHIDDLRTPTVPERPRHRRLRVEQSHLRRTARHRLIKLSMDLLKSNYANTTNGIRTNAEAQTSIVRDPAGT